MISAIIIAAMLAGGAESAPGVNLNDEGAAQGRVTILNCIGSGITCSRVGTTGNLNVANGGGGDGGFPTETMDMIPIPEGRMRGDSTQLTTTILRGGSYFLRRATIFNRIQFRVTQQVGLPTFAIAIYQAPGGGSGVANKVATVSGLSVLVAPGTYTVTPTEGSVTLDEGLIYVVYGRDSAVGSITLRTYTTEPLQLLNSSVNVNVHPTTFTTTIAASALPATFDPRQTPTGQANNDIGDIVAVIRLLSL